MQKLDLTQTPKKLKPHPILKGLPTKLKDVKAFNEIESKLRLILISDHKHKTVKSYVGCERCSGKFKRRQALLEEMGFKNIQQYMEWKKIMTIIKDKKNFQLR